MHSTTPARRVGRIGWALIATIAVGLGHPLALGAGEEENTTRSSSQALSGKQQSIAPIAAAMAAGDTARLGVALNRGLDAGLTVSDVKEILVQLYAYTGFPRSLNALGELMKVVEARKQRGMLDPAGREPSPIPTGNEMLALGTANQTKLLGAPVRGPLFEFAPAIDDFLKRHLFGDIFARDNLDWQSRELATVGALAAMPGVESQLLSHIAVSMNVGLTAAQLREVAVVLAEAGQGEAARRTRAALDTHLAGPARR
jgi:alkylhydroperoxidase/carboxymuconolactone decarboxylase family protein YurZ